MRNRYSTWILTGIVALSLFASPSAAQTEKKPAFISPEQFQVTALLSSPPAENAGELAELHRIQSTRTAEQVERAKRDDAEQDIFIFQNVLGKKFTREILPLTDLLSDHLHNDEGLIDGVAKKHFQRPRPFRSDATLTPVCKIKDDPADFSYPSGHTTTGYLEALVLVMMVPEKRDAILARADEYAQGRLICGVHYPTDIAASKSVAYSMIGIMMNNPQFKNEFNAAKAETRIALGLSTE